jgi:hypothetical protein
MFCSRVRSSSLHEPFVKLKKHEFNFQLTKDMFKSIKN